MVKKAELISGRPLGDRSHMTSAAVGDGVSKC